jgi:hypothetical protein
VEFSLAVEKDVACVASDGGVRAKLVDEKKSTVPCRLACPAGWSWCSKGLESGCGIARQSSLWLLCCAFAVRRVAAMHECDRLGWRKHSSFVVVQAARGRRRVARKK